ncbi:MAG: 23S rRNA (guanosine(2251)-2'-O)-methyltransferase RlmB [Clostridia bacterium]|nr:23S rRNA (guanosine(2251)-2'-O)-methyltransferase RlmB [Clostridia bacterium]MBQ6183076.1 23S rRNA (guanosine(2251)-2'-O)-methyltransferase RlmB [Clostridia bacterium]
MADFSENNSGAVCGRNAVNELLASGRAVDKLLVKSGEKDQTLSVIVARAVKAGIPVVEAPRKRLDSYSDHHQGVVALVPEREYAELDDIFALAHDRGEPPFIVVLDHVNDPHNLGAVIRSAECAGAHGVIIPKRNAAALGSIASKAAAGADAHLPVCRVANIAQTLDELKERGVWIFAAEAGGTSLYECDLSGGAAFVMGSEGEGVSRLVREKSDFVISVPMYGKLNSLNVSAAAAVILFEAARRRHS